MRLGLVISFIIRNIWIVLIIYTQFGYLEFIAANKAIGIQNGPSHTEIKVIRDGLKIVELGARLGGDFITTHLAPLSTGINMVECSIRIDLGERPDLESKWNKGAAIRYFKTQVGTIKEITGVEELKKF